MEILLSAGFILGGYLIGAIPFGLLLVRAITGQDVRQVGSGRTGGTNALRAAGPVVGILTVLGDLGKGWLAVWLARTFVGIPAVEALAGVAAITGHNYSVFIGFKGGAGAMTAVGSAVGLWPWSIIFLLLPAVLMIFITRHASVASITIGLMAATVAILRAWCGVAPWAYVIHGAGTLALILVALVPNIRRLQAGTERRVSLGRKAQDTSS